MSALGLSIRLGRVALGDISKHERVTALAGLEILRARLLEQCLWL